MIDVEARLRATLHAVAEATGTEQAASYVEAPPAPRSRLPLLLTAAAVAVVLGAALTAVPDRGRPVVPPAQQPTPTAPAVPPGPEGGRALADGTLGDERWVLYGVDRLPNMPESPCFKLAIGTREHSPGGCGLDGGAPDDGFAWRQLGPALEGGGNVLVFGVLDGEVDLVVVELGTSDRSEQLAPIADPAHPDGARYLIYVVPRTERLVSLKFATATGLVLRVDEVRVDGPVGG